MLDGINHLRQKAHEKIVQVSKNFNFETENCLDFEHSSFETSI